MAPLERPGLAACRSWQDAVRKWLWILGGLVFLLAIGLVAYLGVFGCGAPQGVTYYGKPLAYWFRPWRSLSDSIYVSCDISLPQPSRGDFNPEAIPVLVQYLQYRHSIWTRLCERLWYKIPIARTKRSLWVQPVPEDRMRQNALGLLRLSKYNASACVPVLIKEYEKAKPAVRVLLADVFADIGAAAAEALPVLRASLVAQDPAERAAAEKAIARIEQPAKRQTP